MQPSVLLMMAAVALTATTWGIYGPILHWGQSEMGSGRLRTFICVGIAYFLVAIVMPILLMIFFKWEAEEKYFFTPMGVVWSLLGGALGAIGALGIIMASTYSPYKANTPLIVMPLVFGLAPVVNTLFQMTVNKTWDQINPFFAAGLILAAVGASTVLIFAPKPAKAHGAPPKSTPAETKPAETKPADAKPLVESKTEEKTSEQSTTPEPTKE
jgi:peptidoglycan/LPS O-acetylase OafA/YrhL